MSKINNIKSRLGRNSFDRTALACGVERGMLKRARSVKADHRRNLAQTFGYPELISLQQHYDMANRNGIGKNLAYGIVNDTWRVSPIIYDGEEDSDRRDKNPTKFEQAIDEVFDRLDLWHKFKMIDLAQRPMRYGGFVFVTSGEPGGTGINSFLAPQPTPDYLVDLRVYHEAQLRIDTANTNPMSIDYGKPIEFTIKTGGAGSTNEWEESSYQVNATRTFCVGENATSGFLGNPCNEACFESLMDLGKVRGSAAEGIFQNASNKYVNMLGENATINDAEEIIQSMEDFDDENSTSLVTTGDVKMLQTNLSDSSSAWKNALYEACAAHDKPAAIVIGEITGERASTENIKSWNRVVMDRQEGFASKLIVDFINDVLIDKFNLPEPSEYINVNWRDLNESTADDKAALAKTRVETNKLAIESRMQPIYSTEYIQQEAGSPAEVVVPLDDGGASDEEEII